MRAVHFARPFEYRLEIPQDTITQGQPLTGTLAIANRDSQPHPGLTLLLALGFGTFRSVKDKGGAALAVLEQLTLAEALTLAPGQEHKVPWTLRLAPDVPVKTKESGPFLLYGIRLDDAANRGMIDLPVALAPHLEALIATAENHFAFEAGSRKNAGGFVEVQFKPPSRYPTLLEFYISLRSDGESLQLKFRGKLKGFQRGAKPGVTERRSEMECTLTGKDFLTAPNLPNRDRFRQSVQEALTEMTPALG